MYLTRGVALLLEEIVPGFHGRSLTHWNADLTHDSGIKTLLLHTHWHLIDRGHVLALHDALQIDITERRHLHAQMVIKVALRTQDEDIGLDTHALQFLDGVLGGFGLQFLSGFQVRYVGEMHTHGITPQLPAQLSDGLHERRTLDVADSTTHLCNHEIQLLLLLILTEHPALDLIRDVRHHLDGLTQIVAMALTVDHRLVDATCGDGVVAGGVNACKTLIVAQVEVGLHTIHRHVALAVLIGVQRPWVDVDIGVEFLNGDLIATRL